mmetsp:Transcript_2019/g.2899  ORF Transcript_2019/g.2899 Transcript_2019/m.2899 type:complete len:409 (+) Transcript_2019:1675-2901(+)
MALKKKTSGPTSKRLVKKKKKKGSASSTNRSSRKKVTTTQKRHSTSPEKTKNEQEGTRVDTTLGNFTFSLPKTYKVIRVIGKGAYGIVAEGLDTKTNRRVAIKKIEDVFNQPDDYQKRVLREVLVMLHFKTHENILTLYDLILPTSIDSFSDVYIVTDLLHNDLRAVLKHNVELSEEHIKYFLYQILRGLKFIHSANVLHRDIKPSNILLSQDMDVKVSDFGLSRGIDKELDSNISTAYVASLFYRAPELLLMWENASKAIDMWSVGCIFAEMLTKPPRQPFFNGRHYTEQLLAILRKIGTPPVEERRGCEKALNYLSSLPNYVGERLSTCFQHASEDAVDLLSKMLVFDPLKRIHVDEALSHPFFKPLHDSTDEPESPPFNFRYADFEGKQSIKELLYETIMKYKHA